MRLLFHEGVDDLPFIKLGDTVPDDRSKIVWVFPDIEKSFGVVRNDNGAIVIDPSMYYITSGEAIRKTEVLISDIKDKINLHCNDERIVEELTNMLLEFDEFIGLLKETKGSSKFLEITKCEDGIFSGNICSRKDPRKKKEL